MLPLPLPKDRLRNGETLCLLFCYLEPTAAFHAHLFQLIQRSPHTIAKAMSNLEKVLWLFRVRRSPPLSMIYLCQPEEIIKCNRDVLWGLLWEIMQCYANSAAGGQTLTSYNSTASFGNLFPQPVNTHYYRPPTTVSQPIGTSNVLSGFSNTSEASRRLSAATTLSSNSAAMNSAKTYHYELPYSPIQRRSLDLSLLEWLESVSILSSILGNIARPPTILALETYIKDGTLFCLLLEKVFTLPLPSGYHRHPHSYSQCLANIGKCVKVLQSCKGMCSRYLYGGVEEDIARGQWDCVLGLLEDLHLFHDTIQQYLVFPSRRNSLPGAMGSDPSKVVIPLIPPIVSSWQQIDRPYLNLGSIQRGRNVSAADSSSSAANSLRQTGAPSANQMISSSATTMNMQNPNHPFTRPAVIVTDDKREEEKKKQQKEYSLLRNLVRLEKYSQPPPSPSTEPLIPPPDTRPQPPLPTNFQPSLDLRQSIPLKRGEREDAAEEEEVEDENDVSFLFSPSQEEKRRDRILTGDAEEEEDDPPDLIPKSVDEFQNSLLQKKAQKYPSVTDMTAGDPAMNFLDLPSASSGNPTQTQSLPARDPIARIPTELQQNHTEQTNPTIKSPSPSSPRKAVARTSIENPSILNSLKIIIDWLSELGIFLPLPQHQFKTYTGNPINDYSIENIAINASLLTDFGKYFSNGLLFARLVMKITHLEITGIEKNPKTQAQRLNNIRKSLEMLAMNNKKIPLRLLSCEEEILRGDSVTILQLMEAMKKAYFFVKT